jgi:DNA-binding MarR family transcriptional regulator
MRVKAVAEETGLHRDTVTTIANSKVGREFIQRLLDTLDERFHRERLELFLTGVRELRSSRARARAREKGEPLRG